MREMLDTRWGRRFAGLLEGKVTITRRGHALQGYQVPTLEDLGGPGGRRGTSRDHATDGSSARPDSSCEHRLSKSASLGRVKGAVMFLRSVQASDPDTKREGETRARDIQSSSHKIISQRIKRWSRRWSRRNIPCHDSSVRPLARVYMSWISGIDLRCQERHTLMRPIPTT